jgi:cytokinin dehydrogenase
MSILRGVDCLTERRNTICGLTRRRVRRRLRIEDRTMTPDRRTLLRAGFGATTALIRGTSEVTADPQADPCDSLRVGAALSCAADIRAAASRDFGNIIHRQPRAVLRPASTADIAGLMRWAGKERLTVAARGQGHSTYGRALTEDGVVIDMSALSAVHDVQLDRVTVDAGATWQSVLEATLAQGLTPPVLTNYLGLSAGGTIVVGGIGGSSSRHGLQTDHVLELDVVTGDGRTVTCSPDSEPELFDAVRGGLAQCGIIARATLRLVRAPQRVRRFQLSYPDLPSLTADQRGVLADNRFDQLQGAVIPEAGGWRYQLEGAVFYENDVVPDDEMVLASLSDNRKAAVVTDLSYHDDALAFAKLEAMLKAKGHWFSPQPWLLTFLRDDNAEEIAGEILSELSGKDVGPFGRLTLYPMLTSAVRTPLVRLPDEPIAFPFNIIRIGASADAEAAERMVAQNRALYQRIRKSGGTLYPVSAFPMSPEDWQDHFGSTWPLLRDAKRRYDPDKLLTPGYNVL